MVHLFMHILVMYIFNEIREEKEIKSRFRCLNSPETIRWWGRGLIRLQFLHCPRREIESCYSGGCAKCAVFSVALHAIWQNRMFRAFKRRKKVELLAMHDALPQIDLLHEFKLTKSSVDKLNETLLGLLQTFARDIMKVYILK